LRPARREPGLIIPLAPSRLAPLETDGEGDPIERPRASPEQLQEPPPLPPTAQADGLRFLRGTLTHALLEHLPGLDPATWQSTAARFVAVRGGDLAPRTRESIVMETLAVLRHPTFAPIFGPTSRAEVPIVAEIEAPHGKGERLRLTGQIDRLAVLENEVLIVDYKTNRPPPDNPVGVAAAYLLQLAAYRIAVSRIFPGRGVRAALLWTDGPRLMVMPDAVLDAAETRLFTIDRASLDAP
jgi:ATP-dependent helicase/nuclease subunit A